MHSAKNLALAALIGLSLTACGGETDEEQARSEGDHVWKNQTQALETAKGVARDLEQQHRDTDDRLRRATSD
jgi:hypothetical protein